MFSQLFVNMILVHMCAAGCLDWLCYRKRNDDESYMNVRERDRTIAACVITCMRRGFCRRQYGYFSEVQPRCRQCIGKCFERHGLKNPYKPAQGSEEDCKLVE